MCTAAFMIKICVVSSCACLVRLCPGGTRAVTCLLDVRAPAASAAEYRVEGVSCALLRVTAACHAESPLDGVHVFIVVQCCFSQA